MNNRRVAVAAWWSVTLAVMVGCSGVATTVPGDAGPKQAVICGTNQCAAGEFCCNESCGVCAPPGGACTQQLCTQEKADCRDDSECRAFSDYCAGCDCRALPASAPPPVCDGPGVRCFADPCMQRTAVCNSGHCVLSSEPTRTQ